MRLWLFDHAFLYSPLPSYFLFRPSFSFSHRIRSPIVDAILKVRVFILKTSGWFFQGRFVLQKPLLAAESGVAPIGHLSYLFLWTKKKFVNWWNFFFSFPQGISGDAEDKTPMRELLTTLFELIKTFYLIKLLTVSFLFVNDHCVFNQHFILWWSGLHVLYKWILTNNINFILVTYVWIHFKLMLLRFTRFHDGVLLALQTQWGVEQLQCTQTVLRFRELRVFPSRILTVCTVLPRNARYTTTWF